MRVVLLAGRGDSTWIVANALMEKFPLDAVIVERPVGAWQRTRSRARRLGWTTAAGQVLFVAYAALLRRMSRSRLREIALRYRLNSSPQLSTTVTNVASVNDASTIELLERLAPAVVVVSGTRILSRTLLSATDTAFINMHAGITPKYRGVHGGYWALAAKDAEHAGVTVHVVDPGIDTGAVLYQATIEPGPTDNFVTYPLLQLAAGIPLLIQAVSDAIHGTLAPFDPGLPSQLYYHPTLWGYLWRRVVHGVK